LNNSTPNQFHRLTSTFAYYATYITLGATMALSGPALPWLARHTSSRLDQISLIFAATSLGYMTGSLLSGWIYDRLPGHRFLALAMLVIAASAALVPLLQSLWFLVALFFLLGAFQGTLDVGCNTLLTWIHSEKVGPFMNGLHFFFGIGTFLAPLIFARVVLASNEIRWAYWSFSLLALPVAAWLWLLPSPPIRQKPPEAAGGSSVNRLFLLIVLFFVLSVGLEFGFGNWIYTFSTRVNLATETSAAYLTSAFWGAFTVGRLLGIGLSVRLRPQAILLADLAGSLSALAVLLLWPDSSLALWAGTILMGLSIASVFATAMAFAERLVHLTGVLVGWIFVGTGTGMMLIPWLVGQLFQRISPRVTMPVLLVDALLEFGLLTAMLLLVRRKAVLSLGRQENPLPGNPGEAD
jgi:FHS family Na+ dependent glucose MFS transporter 1